MQYTRIGCTGDFLTHFPTDFETAQANARADRRKFSSGSEFCERSKENFLHHAAPAGVNRRYISGGQICHEDRYAIGNTNTDRCRRAIVLRLPQDQSICRLMTKRRSRSLRENHRAAVYLGDLEKAGRNDPERRSEHGLRCRRDLA